MADSGVCVLLMLFWTLTNMSESIVPLSVPEAVTLEENTTATVTVDYSLPANQSTVLHFEVTYSSKNSSSIITLPDQVFLPCNGSSVPFTVTAHQVGQVTSRLVSNNTQPSRIRFVVIHSHTVSVISSVIGWIYFLAWSVSFYPQAWENWRRKSVVGLNFDFLALNLTGFLAYSVFNIGLFWIPEVKEEFLQLNPEGINPVSANDVFFSLHALLLCLLYISQAARYQV